MQHFSLANDSPDTCAELAQMTDRTRCEARFHEFRQAAAAACRNCHSPADSYRLFDRRVAEMTHIPTIIK